MKELYIAPELELLRLAAKDRLAAELDFDALMKAQSAGVVSNPEIDIDVTIPVKK